MLRLFTLTSVLLVAQFALSAEIGSRSDYILSSPIVTAKGYAGETHHAVTKDGYVLELHRIASGPHPGPKTRPVVFLMHGILGDSISYTHLGPKYAIGYNLFDAGFDVWMGNARGNKFSRNHVSMSPDKDKMKFFDFTFEEIALIDLPTMMDYVLKITRQDKLHYIGHSQGGTVFFILNSMSSDYHSKIASAHILAGVGYQNNFPNKDLRLLAYNTDVLYTTFRLAGNVELFPPGSDGMFGKSDSGARILDDLFNIDASSELVSGAAVKQIAHYGQNIRDKYFRRWDYGSLQNLSKYGRLSPPVYDLSNINIDVTLHYSLNDTLLSEKDTLTMAKAIPNGKVRKVARDSFTHVDYVASEDVKELVTDFIIQTLKKK